jgi:hypothetical protein
MSHPWTGPQQIGKVKKPKPLNNESPMPPGESWWMSGDFYSQARQRFPNPAPPKSIAAVCIPVGQRWGDSTSASG